MNDDAAERVGNGPRVGCRHHLLLQLRRDMQSIVIVVLERVPGIDHVEALDLDHPAFV